MNFLYFTRKQGGSSTGRLLKLKLRTYSYKILDLKNSDEREVRLQINVEKGKQILEMSRKINVPHGNKLLPAWEVNNEKSTKNPERFQK